MIFLRDKPAFSRWAIRSTLSDAASFPNIVRSHHAYLPPNKDFCHDARRKTWLEKAGSRRIAKALHNRHLPLGTLERLWTPSRNHPYELPHQLLGEVWFCLY